MVYPKYLWNLRFGNETFFYALSQDFDWKEKVLMVGQTQREPNLYDQKGVNKFVFGDCDMPKPRLRPEGESLDGRSNAMPLLDV